jgi:prolyl-tRNA synthetase
VNLRPGDAAVDAACEQAYAALTAAGKEPLLDDRDERPGAKFAAMDLVGLPWQLIIGPKGLADGVVELKRRATGERQSLPLDAALKAITA